MSTSGVMVNMATKDAKSAKKAKDVEKKKSVAKLEKEENLTAVTNDEENSNSKIVDGTSEPSFDGVESVQDDQVQSPSPLYFEPPLSDLIVTNFVGDKVHGLYEGQGVISFEGNHQYEGELSEGLMHGQGKYTWSHGLVYEGDFVRNVITGKGTFIWPDGSTYIGDVNNGKRHGHGTFTCNDQHKTYSGMWHEGKRHGKGRLDFTSCGDSFYDGDWDCNVRQGYGTRQYPSGNVYVGTWRNNVRHGEGMMKWFDSDQIYEGCWEDGIQNGWGQHVWLLRRMATSQYPLRNMYIGEFHKGLRHGFGTFIYSSGARYEGEWQDNVKFGQGKFVFKNGRVYEGMFRHDRILEYPDHVIDGTCSPDVQNIRTRTPLPSEAAVSFSNASTNTLSPSFQLDIKALLSEIGSVDDIEEQSRQVMFVILGHISTLRNIYAFYSSLGSEEHESPDNTYIMKRIQFWRLLKDCRLHHHGNTLCDMDRWLAGPEVTIEELHDPNEKILQRQFINMLIVLAYRLHNEDCGPLLSGCMTKLLNDSIIKYACTVKGFFYYETRRAINALVHYDHAYFIYNQLCSPRKHAPYEASFKMREFLLMMKDCNLINNDLTALAIIKILSKDDPNAADGDGCCNLELEMTFLEFLEALIGCAEVYVTETVMKQPNTPHHSSLFTPDGRLSAIGSVCRNSQVGEDSMGGAEEDIKKVKVSTSNNTLTTSDFEPNRPEKSHDSYIHLENLINQSTISSHDDEADDSRLVRSDVSIVDRVMDKEELASEEVDEEVEVEELDDDTRAFNFWTHQVHIFFSQKFFPAIEKLLNLRASVLARHDSVVVEKQSSLPFAGDQLSSGNFQTPLVSTELASAVGLVA